MLKVKHTALSHILFQWAATQPDRLAFTYLGDGITPSQTLTYRALHHRAQVIAEHLSDCVSPGNRALLMFPPGLEFISAFFGCLYAGVIAVPTPELDPLRAKRSRPRICSIEKDSQASAILTTKKLFEGNEGKLEDLSKITAGELLFIEEFSQDSPSEGDKFLDLTNEIAFLQYTSGSTSTPKGVIVTQQCLIEQLNALTHSCGLTDKSISLNWMPHFHDFGLINGLLLNVYVGTHTFVMAPTRFLRNPLVWLQAITKFQVTHSSAPNFAYDLCVTKTEPQERVTLNLQKWSFASCGAEPIRVETMDRFIQTFEPFGFNRRSFVPAYGLAEYTLAATITPHGSLPSHLELEAQDLEKGSIVPARTTTRATRRIVSCGCPIQGADLRIIDEKTLCHSFPDRIGEIWLAGPSVANGYWQHKEETHQTFNAFTADTREGPFLRTGDLGFLQEGNLYVTGRLKDLIIIRGNNYFPHDIERTVQESHLAFQQGATAAFSVPNGTGEQLVVIQELRHHKPSTDFEHLTSATRQAVSLEHDLPVYAVVLVKSGSIPKTTSGKIQRQACKEAFLTERLTSLHASIKAANQYDSTDFPLTQTLLLNASSNERQRVLENFLVSSLAHDLSMNPGSLKSDQHLNELGIDSLMSAQLTCKIERVTGVVLPPSTFLQHLPIGTLATRLLGQLPDRFESQQTATTNVGIPVHEYHLSPNQKAQWFLHQLDPQSAAGNVAVALQICQPLDETAALRSLNLLVNRHPILRTVYESQSGVPFQRILPSVDLTLELRCVKNLDWEDVKRDVISTSQQPFILSQAPLFRAHLFEKSSTNHLLLLSTHHIAADGWSMHLLVEDFVQLYSQEIGKDPCPKLGTPPDYVRFSRWQTDMLKGDEGHRLGAFWDIQLAGELPRLNLTYGPVEPLLTTPRTASQTFTINSDLTDRLRAIAKQEGVTLYVMLLAVLQVLLHRYTGQEDILVCTPMSGRIRPEHQKTFGNLTNTVILRETLVGNPHFRKLLRQVSKTVTAVIDHQAYPFSLLVERLRSQRKETKLPLGQVLFVLQDFKLFDDLNDRSSKFPNEGKTHAYQDITVDPFVIPQPTGQFDLTLEVAENGPSLTGHFEYNRDLFDPSFVERLASHFQILLDGVTISSDSRIWDFPFFQPSERRQVLVEWNPAPAQLALTATAHELIEYQVTLTPGTIALVSEKTELTYDQLNKRANQVAHRLLLAGVGPDMPVGICIERSIEMVIGILAILKAGGAYVPLDPNLPKTRLAFIVEDLQPSVILTTSKLRKVVPEGQATLVSLDECQEEISRQPDRNLTPTANPKNLAYIIYTSGSTGRPKGVQIEHQSLVAFAQSFRKECELREGDRILQFSSLAFDASVEEIFPILISGGTLVIPTEMTVESPERFLEKCCELNITILDLPTAYWHDIALQLDKRPIQIFPSLRLMIIGGEKASPRAVHAWQANANPSVHLLNTYGPTEATVTATTYDLTSARQREDHNEVDVGLSGNVPIGRPLAHVRVYLLDQYLQPVPIGVPGELYLGGHSLARGYHNRPEETVKNFIRDPLSTVGGTRLFRTGDLCRYRPDGILEYLERTDRQVKLRGFRIELGEIETVMQEHQGVYEALVTLKNNAQIGSHLIAYFIPVRQPGLPARELRNFLKERLPNYMIPATFMAMDSWPRTSTGKIDRSQLPEVDETQWESEENYVAPRSPVEQATAELYCDILGLTRVGVHDHFFELGGHSLLAVQLVSRLREMFRCDIPLRLFFENPTVAGLADAIASVLQGEVAKGTIPSITPVSKDRPLPLSSSQERIYFLHKLAPQSAAYNIPIAIRLHGQLNHEALEESLNQLIRKHESLRTSIREESGTLSQVISSTACVAITNIDLRQVPDDERQEEARKKADEAARHPFDLTRAPLLRGALLQLANDDYVLILTIHHIVSDQWSFAILGKELGQFYNVLCSGKTVQTEPLPIQYADFACWQRQWLTREVLENQYSFWISKLSDLPILEMPTDHPRRPDQTFTGTYISLDLTKPLLNKLQRLSATENGTLYMLCLAAFKVLLNRYTGQTDIVIGSPVANRHWPDVQSMVGTFVNTLVLRTDLSGEPTFRELLKRVRDVALEGYAHQDLPFEMLVRDLAPTRTLNRMPLIQVLFNFGNAPFERVKFTGLSLSPFEIDRGASQFDLSLSIDTMASGKAFLEFNTDLFDYDHMALMLTHYHELLQSIVATPDTPISALNLLTPAEKQQILVEWNTTDTPLSIDVSTINAFELQAMRTPDSLAAISEEATLTYSELNTKADRLAFAFRQLGVVPDLPIGVAIDRTPDLLVALLGIMKAGGAYVPLDPQGPPERFSFMLKNSKTPILVTQRRLIREIPGYQGTIFFLDADIGGRIPPIGHTDISRHKISQSNLAYVIYTSGSTGQPKGVEVEHRSLINFLHAMSRMLAVTSTDIFLAVTPVTFDIAALELFLPLSVGARVVLVSGEEARDGKKLMERLQTSGATVMQATPATWRMLIQAGWQGSKNLKVLCGGEALTRALAEELLTRSQEVWNLYGPTETTIWSTAQKVRSGTGPVSIGRPIDNTRTLILDKNSALTPVGIPGELYIGGEGVARGYLGRPDLSTERFQPNSFGWPKERLYKTGDLARWRADGSLDYLGRDDHQVKIRGIRMELPEIESRLNQMPEINQSVVLAIETDQSDKKLVAFIVTSTEEDLDIEGVRRHLKTFLPMTMVPSAFVFLPELPLTPNGKIDRAALLTIKGTSSRHCSPSALPENNLQRQLIRIWEPLLDRQGVGIDDHFFDLGGHSILALQLFTEIEKLTGKRLPLVTLFKAPTIRELAAILQSSQRPTNWQSIVPINPFGTSPPLFAVPGIGGNVVGFYELVQLLGNDQPFYGLQSRGLDGKAEPFTTVEDIASHYVSEIQSVQPTGPYHLVGACIGGIIAFEMAQQLSAKGHKVALLALLETWPPASLLVPRWTTPNRLRPYAFFLSVAFEVIGEIFRASRKERLTRISKALRGMKEMVHRGDVYRGDREMRFRDKVSEANRKAAGLYQPQPFSGRIDLIIASERPVNPPKDTRMTWCDLALGGYSVDELPAASTGHLFKKPHVTSLAEKLNKLLSQAQTPE
ncbi:MAG: amino acid adenylation domain-containing protein [Nitrospirales bacterium]